MARRPTRPVSTPPVPTAPPATSETTKNPAWLRPVILAIGILALLGWFSTESADSDTWWDLKTREYIVQNHKLPVPDPFSFTTYLGKPAYEGEAVTRDFNLKHEWLSQVIFYLAYSIGGFPALILLRSAIVSAYCVLAGLMVFHRTNGFY